MSSQLRSCRQLVIPLELIHVCCLGQSGVVHTLGIALGHCLPKLVVLGKDLTDVSLEIKITNEGFDKRNRLFFTP